MSFVNIHLYDVVVVVNNIIFLILGVCEIIETSLNQRQM